MIDPNAPADTKLAEARRLFEDTTTAYEDFLRDAAEDVAFESGEQWSDEDKAALREELRPTLTFNLVQSIVDHNIGTLEDQKKAPRVVAVSRNDRFLADILNDLLERVRNEIDLSACEMEAAHWSCLTGIGGLAIDANEDPDRDDYIQLSVTPLAHNEFRYDPYASKPDLSDAEYIFRDRWMNESEFKRTYPKHADAFDRLLVAPTDVTTLGGPIEPREPRSSTEDDYRLLDTWGIDRTKREVRVVHLEYRVAVKVRRALPLEDGDSLDLTEPELEAAQTDTEFRTKFELDPKTRTVIQIRWLEFAGANELLFDDVSPLPIRGFSVTPFPWRRDRRKRTFQGKVRPLKDPQREINKRFSQEVHLINSMAQPGTDVEEGATPMPIDEFERAGKTPGGVRRLNPGGLEKINDRPMPQIPEAVARLHENAIQLVRVISNTTMDTLLEPRGIPEAAATAQLRHRQSTLAMVPVIRNYGAFQRTVARRILEIITNAFSDQQVEDMLSNADQFKVRGGTVTEIGGEQRTAEFKDIRSLRYNVELVTTSESENSNQLVQLQFLDTAKEREIPIAPDVYLDLLPLPRDTKDRLKEFALEQAQIGLQMQQAQLAQVQQQISMATEADRQRNLVDAARLGEERRHNFAAEMTQAVKVGFEHQGRIAEIIAKAGAAEMDLIVGVLELIARAQEAKLGAVERGLSSGPNGGAQ